MRKLSIPLKSKTDLKSSCMFDYCYFFCNTFCMQVIAIKIMPLSLDFLSETNISVGSTGRQSFVIKFFTVSTLEVNYPMVFNSTNLITSDLVKIFTTAINEHLPLPYVVKIQILAKMHSRNARIMQELK